MQNKQVHTHFQEAHPLVTFVVTCYNLPVPMLCECLNSILALPLSDDEREIIVVDDGSEVSPMNGLMQYGNHIIYVRQRNQGVSVARNTALRMARGQYIQFVDGDDHLLQAPYEHCLSLIRQHKDLDVVLFDFSKSETQEQSAYHDTAIQAGSDFLRNNNIHGAVWCMLFRQTTRSKLLFTPGIEYGEDEEFTPQLLLRAETLIQTNAKAYYYRPRTTSAVHQQDDERKQKRLDDTMEVIIKLHRTADRLPQTDRLALQRRVAQLTMDYIYNTIVLTHSRQILNERLAALRQEGLFPLPDRDYSRKYKWFRKMTNSSLGLTILLNTLPLMKKER